MPVREGCRQLPSSYVAYLGPMPRTLALKGFADPAVELSRDQTSRKKPFPFRSFYERGLEHYA
jgi:hypothetical protein